jgi:hypothetical protein
MVGVRDACGVSVAVGLMVGVKVAVGVGVGRSTSHMISSTSST